MMNKIRLLLTGMMLAVFLFNVNSFAQTAGEVKTEDKYGYLTALTYVDTLTMPLKRRLRENKIGLDFFSFSAAYSCGSFAKSASEPATIRMSS